jgi:hypothetical protein
LVDLVFLETVSYIVGALGVFVAAVFYIINIRETMKNRRATTANNIQQLFLSEEWQQRYFEVMSMQWTDFDDFKRKYDSIVSPQSYVKRNSILVQYDNLGRQYRSGVIDLDAFGSVSAFALVLTWLKFKPIIEGYRGLEYPNDSFSDFEYLADAFEKRLKNSDPEFMKRINTLSWSKPIDQ